MPVSMSASPEPSRASDTEISVSRVLRSTVAVRIGRSLAFGLYSRGFLKPETPAAPEHMSYLTYAVDPPAKPCKGGARFPEQDCPHGAFRLSLLLRKRFGRPSRQGVGPGGRRGGGPGRP